MRQKKPDPGTGACTDNAQRLYRAVLRLYPDAVLDEYGKDMEETFRLRLADVRKRGRLGWAFAVRECAGAVALSLHERIRPGRSRAPERLGMPRSIRAPGGGPGTRWVSGLSDLIRDLARTARSLFRRPGLTVNALLALGLGIGLTTIMFSVIYGVLLRPLPLPDGERLLHLEQQDPSQGLTGLQISVHDFQDWREQQSTLEALGAFYTGTLNLSGSERPERYFGAFVTANTFDVLGVEPVLGRTFQQGEDAPQAPLAALISHSVWRDRYDEDPGVLGSVVRVNGEAATLIGVMPEGFSFPYWQDVWVPMRVNPLELERGGGPGLQAFGKLDPGVALEQAITEFQGISDRLARAYPETNESRQAHLERYADSYRDNNSPFFAFIMMATAFSVLLLACFNVANLLLARAVTRMRDMAIRTAMGASRRRVVAELLYEALLLAGGGALLGIAIAIAGTTFLDRWITLAATFPLPFWIEIGVEAPVLVFAVAAGVVSALASGFLPALRASRTDVQGLLKNDTRSMSSLRIGRLSRFMVLAELTVSALLLVAGGHLVRDIGTARHASYGFQAENVLTARVGPLNGVLQSRDARQAFFRALRESLISKPGVEAAALSTTLPGQEAGWVTAGVEGSVTPDEEDLPFVRYAAVSVEYFESVGVGPQQGRTFNASDGAESEPVALVNSSFVQRFFPEGNPVGRRIRVGEDGESGPWHRIVGVVPDLSMDGALEPEGVPEGLYVPLAQSDARFLSISVRAVGDPMTLAPTLRDAVATLQPDTPLYFVMTLQDSINIGLLDFMLVGGLFAALGLAAFLLGSVGLYGLMAFVTRQRVPEVGLRMAVGARASDVLRMVARQGTFHVFVGVATGLLLAFLFRAAFIAMGQEVTPWYLDVTLLVCGALVVTGMAATLIPAYKATTVDPMDALRRD